MCSAVNRVHVKCIRFVPFCPLHYHLLTLYASREDSRPWYWEAIVIQLHLLHERNIILLHTQHRVKSFWLCFLPLVFLESQVTSCPTSPWLCSSPHKQRRQCCCAGLCLSCDWTHPRCSDLFHLCPRLLRSDRLNCRHPTKILISEIIYFFLAFSQYDRLWLKFKGKKRSLPAGKVP